MGRKSNSKPLEIGTLSSPLPEHQYAPINPTDDLQTIIGFLAIHALLPIINLPFDNPQGPKEVKEITRVLLSLPNLGKISLLVSMLRSLPTMAHIWFTRKQENKQTKRWS